MSEISRSEFKNNTIVLYPDNTTGEISPGDLRSQMNNIADSAVFKSTNHNFPPGNNDDSVNSGENGAFNIGDMWIDELANKSYVCVDDTPTSAVWINITLTSLDVADLGALMDSEITDLTAIKTLSAPPNTNITVYGASLVASINDSNARSTLGLGSASLNNTVDFATAAQGLLADTAIQPSNTLTQATWNTGTSTTEALISPLKLTTTVDQKIITKANIDSPTFTGVPQSPTVDIFTNSNQIATTSFIQNVIDTFIDPAALFTPSALFVDGRPGHHAMPLPGFVFTDTAGTLPAALGDQVARVNSPVAGQPNLIQADAAKRPIFGRMPASGVRNLIFQANTVQNSENFIAWGFGPDSGLGLREIAPGKGPFSQGWRIVDGSATSNTSLVLNMGSAIISGQHVISFYFSYDFTTPPTGGETLFSMQGTGGAAQVRIQWNPDGTVAQAISGSPNTEAVGIENLGDGLYRAWARDTFPTGLQVLYCWPASWIPGGTSTGGVILYAAQVERSTTGPTAYQQVTSSFDVTETNQRDIYYLQGDGINDVMVTDTAIDMTTESIANIVSGLEKLSDDTAFFAIGHGNDLTPGNISIWNSGSLSQWTSRTRGDSNVLSVASIFGRVAPDKAIITSSINIPDSQNIIYYNRNATAINEAVPLSGFMQNSVLSILAGTAEQTPINGRWFGHTFCKMDEDDRRRVEYYHFRHTGELPS